MYLCGPYPPTGLYVCRHRRFIVLPFFGGTRPGNLDIAKVERPAGEMVRQSVDVEGKRPLGGGLDEMTLADDFHLLLWRNFLLLSSVMVGVLIPVGLRYFLRRGVGSIDDIEAGRKR